MRDEHPAERRHVEEEPLRARTGIVVPRRPGEPARRRERRDRLRDLRVGGLGAPFAREEHVEHVSVEDDLHACVARPREELAREASVRGRAVRREVPVARDPDRHRALALRRVRSAS